MSRYSDIYQDWRNDQARYDSRYQEEEEEEEDGGYYDTNGEWRDHASNNSNINVDGEAGYEEEGKAVSQGARGEDEEGGVNLLDFAVSKKKKKKKGKQHSSAAAASPCSSSGVEPISLLS